MYAAYRCLFIGSTAQDAPRPSITHRIEMNHAVDY